MNINININFYEKKDTRDIKEEINFERPPDILPLNFTRNNEDKIISHIFSDHEKDLSVSHNGGVKFKGKNRKWKKAYLGTKNRGNLDHLCTDQCLTCLINKAKNNRGFKLPVQNCKKCIFK